MRYLAQRMNPRVGAAGTMEYDRVVGHPAYRCGHTGLDGGYVRCLGLPAVKTRAIIFNTQGNP